MISSKFTLFLALLAIAFTAIAALPIEDADSFEEGLLDVEETTSSTAMDMFLTCDNEFELFVNGNKVCSGNSWTTTYRCKATVNPGDVIALDGRDAGGPAAFIGVFNGVPTKPSDWRCKDTSSPGQGWNTNNFDDSSWPQAVSYSRNDANNIWRQVGGGSRPDIPADAQWLWTADNNNHDRVFCRYVPIKEAAVVKHARDALDAQKGDYKTLFVAMMKQIKSGLNTMKTDAETEFQAITSKRNAVKDVLSARIASAQEKEKAFSSATAALQAADQACTSAKNTATAASATLKATTDALNSRNPIIEKELAVIRQLVDKVGELKSINLQESSGQDAARSAAYQQTRDMIESLQTFEDEAAPLSEMIEMAREHAEFTQPIVKLLKELEAKLLAELDSLRSAVTSAQAANTKAQSNQASTCEQREAKRLEEASAKTQLTAANAARDSTQQEFNDLQKLWESTRTKTEAALQTYTQEMITLNSLESCAVQAVNPVRKSCWEIKSLHPDAPSGVYKIRGPGGEPLSVQCDMTKQGGGWTLAGVAIFGQHGKAGWNSESFLNQGSSDSLTSHWHMSSDFMNSLAENGEYRVNCFESNNDYERLWKGVRNYKWSQVTSASSSSSVDGVNQFPTGWAGHHWGLTSGNNERDAVITSHSDNQWACAGNQGPRGEGYTGRGGRSNMRIWLR